MAWIFRSRKPWTTCTPACSIARDHSMFRRSSNRALSSTRHTACLARSAASISAGSSAESSDVRYTVVLTPTTSGSLARGPHERLDRGDERVVGQVHQQVAGADLREQVAGAPRGRGKARAGHGNPRLVLELGPVEIGDLAQVGHIHQPRRVVHLCVGHAEAAVQPLAHAGGHPVHHLEPHRVAEPAPAQLRLDRLEQVVSLVRELEVGIAGDAEEALLDDLDPREERGSRSAR